VSNESVFILLFVVYGYFNFVLLTSFSLPTLNFEIFILFGYLLKDNASHCTLPERVGKLSFCAVCGLL